MKKWYLALMALLLLAVACTPTSGGQEAVDVPNEVEAPAEVDVVGEPMEEELVEEETAVSASSEQATSSTERFPAEKYAEYEIVTLLPPDAIRSIDDPQFISASEADNSYAPDELVMGVEFDGDARAYSVPLLSSHEIVNDTVGGRKIAVTW